MNKTKTIRLATKTIVSVIKSLTRFSIVRCVECRRLLFYKNNISSKPQRHILSPNGSRFSSIYCSNECKKKRNREAYLFWAKLDENCSDCSHFEGMKYSGRFRKGHCKKRNILIEIEPLQPYGKWDYNESGCFNLHERYKEK